LKYAQFLPLTRKRERDVKESKETKKSEKVCVCVRERERERERKRETELFSFLLVSSPEPVVRFQSVLFSLIFYCQMQMFANTTFER